MELCKEYKSICLNEGCHNAKEGFELDYQVNLPQYLDDIEKIIKCSVKAVVTDYDYQNSSIVIYGKALISLTYRSAQSGLLSNIFEEEFSKSFDVGNIENFSFAKICLITKYSNFHLINQRRIDIHISLTANMKLYHSNSCDVLNKCDSAMMKKYSTDYLICKGSGITNVEIEESIRIPDSSAQIKNIVNCFTQSVVDEYKIIKEKMLVKGTITVSVSYESIESKLEKAKHSFTFSKIIEMSSLEENDTAFIQTLLSGIYLKAKADNDNQLKSIELIGKLSINYQLYHIDNLSAFTDSYVPKYEVKLSNKALSVNEAPTYYFDDKLMEYLYKDDICIVEVIDLNAEITNQKIVDSALIIEISVSVIYYDENNNICYYEKSMSNEIRLSDAKATGVSACCLKSFDYVIKSETELLVRANIEYSAYLYNENRVGVITDVDIDNEISMASSPQLTLYFAEDKESLWNIAKKFSTSEKLIIEENDLDGELINGSRILIIPGI